MAQSFNDQLIEMIRCPLTKSKLVLASGSVVADLNGRIGTGTVVNRAGQKVCEILEGGFLNQDHSFLMPVRGGIVILTDDQAIPLGAVPITENKVNHE